MCARPAARGATLNRVLSLSHAVPRRLLRQLSLSRWPRVELAAKAAAAATIAWQLALWLPFAPAETYPYYAPLGAVVATHTSIASSIRGSLQSVLAVITGAVVGVLVMAAGLPGLATIPVVVASGTLLAGLRVFGEMNGWVTTVALFVLVIGYGDPLNYLLAYTGLTLMGAVVAITVTMLVPTVPAAQTTRALRQLARTLADQLDDLARGLDADLPPTSEQWRRRSQSIAPVLASVRDRSQDVRTSLRGNPRARREHAVVERQRHEAIVLDAIATRVEDLTDLILDVRGAQPSISVDMHLRRPTAEVLRAAATAVRPLGDVDRPHAQDVQRMRATVQHLSATLEADPPPAVRDRHAAGAVITGLRRLLGALLPTDDNPGQDPDVLRPSEPTSRTLGTTA